MIPNHTFAQGAWSELALSTTAMVVSTVGLLMSWGRVRVTTGTTDNTVIFRVPIGAAPGSLVVGTSTITRNDGVSWFARGVRVGRNITITAAEDGGNNVTTRVTAMTSRTITVAATLTANADDDAMIVTPEYFRVTGNAGASVRTGEVLGAFHFVNGLEVVTTAAIATEVTLAFYSA